VPHPAEYADTERLRYSVRAPSERPSSIRLGSLPANSEQDLRFVQDRMAVFAKATFLISTMFLIATTTADLVTEAKRYSWMSRTSHVFGTLVALVLWRTARSRHNFSPAALQALDVAAMIGICWPFASMAHYAVQPYGFYTGLLAITHVSVSRAMIVPSVPLLTLVLTATSFVGLIASRAALPFPPEIVEVVGTRSRALLEACLWSAAGTATAAVASTVIYGLHERAREARQLGQYALEEKIGEGGMGEVYRARHAMLRRPTAVKLLSGDGSEQQLRRFEKEVQLTARLTHPNTISIYDYGRTPEGIFYYAMELLEGLTLEELVERHGPQPAGRVIHILLQICGALREAHRVGLIHRDIKPANIYLCSRGDVPDVVKVLDFGLVREVKNEGDVTRSNINSVVGTPLFMSPDAILTPDQIDARADIYGVGCVAYYLLTGTPPFSGNSVIELCGHHLHTAPEPPSRRHPVPLDLERVILSCMAKQRAERPQSAQALARALESCEDAHTWIEPAAEAWWSAAAVAQSEPRAQPAISGEQRRTVCCVDFEKRFGTNDRTG
jgi:serine/threonine-protein kinase